MYIKAGWYQDATWFWHLPLVVVLNPYFLFGCPMDILNFFVLNKYEFNCHNQIRKDLYKSTFLCPNSVR